MAISRSESDGALAVSIFITVGLVATSLGFAWDETVGILNAFSNWIMGLLSDPEQAWRTFSSLESRRLTSFESAFLSPLYILMTAYPAAGFTRSASRSWVVVMFIAAVFGSVASTFGFYFFDLFMARCILFDSARKGLPSWHSVLLCAVFGAPAGWLSSKLTAAYVASVPADSE